MEIIQKPDSLSLLGNLKKFLISSNAEVDFSLSVSIDGADVSLLQESYTPDSSGNISIDVREVCGQYLKTNLPSDNVFLQSDALRTFTATIGSSSWSFTVVNASVRNLTLSALEYLQYNFLTLQPQSKQVSWHSPEYLTYYFTEQADVQAKFYLKSGGTETVTVATISPTPEGGSGTIQLVNKVYTINTSLSRLMALSSHDTEDLQGIVDVWVQGSVSRLSYIQRYVYAPSTGEEHHYFAVNSLGGIDTFTFIGEQKITGEIEHQAAENDDKKITVTSGGQRKYRQNTGYLGEASSEWLWEFLHSSRQWVVAAAAAEEIVVVSSSLSQGDLTNLNSSSFDFLLARDGGLLPESRRDETFPDITVPSPVSDLFFLNPRIIDFPAAPSDAELVFPVQTLYSNEWSYLTLQELQERLSIAASLNHTHRNLSVLQDLGDSNGQLTYRGAVVGSGGGISLPIAISDVEGLSTALNNKANISHSHSWNDITDKPHFVDFTSEQTITGLKHMHHLDILLSMAIPQAAPEDPEAGKIYFWLDENGNSASAPYGGSVANVYPLTITKNNVSWLVYNPGTQAETVDLEIPTKVSQLQNDSGYLTQHQSLAGYATQSWVQQQGYLTSHQSLSGYATESWVGIQIDALNLDSVLAGIASNSARISTLEDRVKIDMPYRLSDLQNDLSLDDLPDGSTRKLANYVPITRKVNGKALNTDITLSLDDVADGNTRKLANYVQKSGDTMTGTLTGPLFVGAVDAYSKYFSVPQAAPSNPETGKIYFWLDENGNSASAPSGGSVANVYPLTITVNHNPWLAYSPGTQAETVDLEIPTKVSQLQNDSGYLTQHQSLAGYATQSWVQQQGYLTSHQSLSGYATESWVGTQIDALNLDSVLAGIASNSARISTLEDRVKIDMPYRLSDLQNDLSLDDLPDGNSRKLANYLPLAGGTMTGAISSMDIKPKTTATYDLGTASLRWADLYVTAIKWHTSDADSLQFYSNSGTHYAKLTTDTFRLDCNVRPASGHSLGQANYPWDTIVGNTIQARTALNALGTLSVSGAATFSSGLTSEGDVLISASSAYLKFSAQDAGLYWETQVNSQTMYRPFLSIDDHDCITIGNGDLADITFANDAYAGYLEADFLYSNGPVYAEGNITTESTLEAQGGFVPPTAAPANPVAGKVYFWIDLTGNSVNS